MRLPSRTASSTSQWHISLVAEVGDSTNTTVSASRMRLPRRRFQSSPPEMPWRSIVVVKPVRPRATSSWSANCKSLRLYEINTPSLPELSAAMACPPMSVPNATQYAQITAWSWTNASSKGPLNVSRALCFGAQPFIHSGPLTRQAINYIVRLAGEKAKLGRVWPHMLRHSCGYYLADKGTDLRTM